ncbi:hypothetical protein R1flu_006293 [Riccia fluitans]|uniref:Uncharacterized protein n=1 Tax=Riccia fluitans TaxID=41844 RepID=A0ABD1YWM8_9MARC
MVLVVGGSPCGPKLLSGTNGLDCCSSSLSLNITARCPRLHGDPVSSYICSESLRFGQVVRTGRSLVDLCSRDTETTWNVDDDDMRWD